ncbi:hypothetical protein A5733_11425 [Mycobacterium sp. NS-7484]|uniref:hypothetical protein n=1 Tax=Mycobacterium sp. NS-7484 TaxID=1834161 RepID=UPI00096C9135|nr:hypothetical protein [Mycobacterium sp. NS-7484]OMB96758.1 hypothetical protein A5733_11425 [Mycobacterium sp. NS-7484]
MNATEDDQPLGENPDLATIERAVELGFLAGADRHRAIAQVSAGRIRERVHGRITELAAVFTAHNAETYDGRVYRCPCKLRGTRAEWERHLADKLADALAGE